MRTATSGSESRRASKMVRLTPRAHERLCIEAKRRGMTLEATLEALVPTSKISVDECRYCGKITRAPKQRHRHHEPGCALWSEKEAT